MSSGTNQWSSGGGALSIIGNCNLIKRPIKSDADAEMCAGHSSVGLINESLNGNAIEWAPRHSSIHPLSFGRSVANNSECDSP